MDNFCAPKSKESVPTSLSSSSFGPSLISSTLGPRQQFRQLETNRNSLGLELPFSTGRDPNNPFRFSSLDSRHVPSGSSSVTNAAFPQPTQFARSHAHFMEAIRTATHEALMESRNPAYMAAAIKVNTLEAEKKALWFSYSLLLEKLSTPVPTTTTPEVTSKSGLPTPTADTNTTPLNQEDYPDVPFWTQKHWESFRQTQKNPELHTKYASHDTSKQQSKLSRTLAYITDTKGNGVDVYQARAIRKTCRQIWTSLAEKGNAPSTWSKAGETAVDFYRQTMYQKHPDLRLCVDHWKVDKLAVSNYPGWSRTRKEMFSAAKEKAESSLDDSSSTSSVETKKRSAESSSNVAPKKRKLASADAHPAPPNTLSNLRSEPEHSSFLCETQRQIKIEG